MTIYRLIHLVALLAESFAVAVVASLLIIGAVVTTCDLAQRLRRDPVVDPLRRALAELRRQYLRSHSDQRRLVDDPGFLPLLRAKMTDLDSNGARETLTPEQFLERYPMERGER